MRVRPSPLAHPAAERLRRFPRSAQRLIEERGGLLLHGCGLVREGRAWLFLAPSGGGKSTLARLSARKAECLSDEHLVLLPAGPQGDAARSPPRLLSPPCCPSARFPDGAPLAAAFALAKGPDLSFSPMTPAALAAAILREVYPSTWEAPHAERLLASVRRVAEAVPAFTLRFALDSDPWKRIPALI